MSPVFANTVAKTVGNWCTRIGTDGTPSRVVVGLLGLVLLFNLALVLGLVLALGLVALGC